jgi:hypothetical protein
MPYVLKCTPDHPSCESRCSAIWDQVKPVSWCLCEDKCRCCTCWGKIHERCWYCWCYCFGDGYFERRNAPKTQCARQCCVCCGCNDGQQCCEDNECCCLYCPVYVEDRKRSDALEHQIRDRMDASRERYAQEKQRSSPLPPTTLPTATTMFNTTNPKLNTSLESPNIS